MNAERLTTPRDKVQQLQRQLGRAAKASKKRRFHALYDKVHRWDVLWAAWHRVRKNKGAAGIDRETIQDIEKLGVGSFLEDIQKQLMEKRYHPKAVRREYIPKDPAKTKFRPLGIPTVRDRVVQMATKMVLEPIFEEDFCDTSYGFRPGRNQKQALERIRKACNRKGYWVLDADIQGFFDNINQDKLMMLVEMRVSDRRMLKLLRKWLNAGVMEEGEVHTSELGVPQGGVISPLLSNIYLHYFDFLWERHGAHLGELTRYADDFVIVSKTKKDAQHALKLTHQIMARLELSLHPTKTKLVSLWEGKEGFDFLGMHHRSAKAQTSQNKTYYTLQQWPCEKAMKSIRSKVKEGLAPPNRRSLSLKSHIAFLNPKIRSWKNYYTTPYSHRQMIQLDWYILQRLAKWWARKVHKKTWIGMIATVRKMATDGGLLTLYA